MLNWRDTKHPKAGGAEQVTLRHLEAMVNRCHWVEWWSLNYKVEGWESVFSAPAFEIVKGIVFRRFSSRAAIIREASRRYFHLVIDQHHGIPWYTPLWCRSSFVSYIHEILGPVWQEFHTWPISAIGRIQELITLRSYRNCPFWVPSKSTKDELMKLGVRDVVHIPNGCDTIPLSILPEKLMNGELRLVTVGRLTPAKPNELKMQSLPHAC